MATVLLPIPLLASAHVAVARSISVSLGSHFLLVAAGLLAVGGCLAVVSASAPFWFFVLLMAPLYQALVVRYLYRRFVNRFGRDPVDVVLNFQSGLVHDRSLTMGYLLLGLFVPFGVLAWSVWGVK